MRAVQCTPGPRTTATEGKRRPRSRGPGAPKATIRHVEDAILGTHRTITRAGALLASAMFLFAACSSAGGSAAPSEAAPSEAAPSAAASAAASAAGDPMADLVAAAQGEGKLTTIALPHDWCNYGEVI